MTSTRTRAECGRLSGLSTLDKYGPEHYAMLARKMHAKYGTEYIRSCARKGGQAYAVKYINDPRYKQLNVTTTPYDDEGELPL